MTTLEKIKADIEAEIKGCETAIDMYKENPDIVLCYKTFIQAYIKVLQIIDKYAKQEPCDDVVSRQAVDEMIKAEMPERGMWKIEGDKEKETVCEVCVDLMQKLSDLPSVRPQEQKTGHFRDCISRDYLLSIANKDGAYGYVSAHDIINAPCYNPQEPKTGHWIVEVWNNKEHHTCSVCQRVVDYEPCYHYCPYCGAKMVEPQERSDKE